MVKQCQYQDCDRVATRKCRALEGKIGCRHRYCEQHNEEHENLPHLTALCFRCGEVAKNATGVSSLSPLSARYGGKSSVFQFCSQECLDVALQFECAYCHETKKITGVCPTCFKYRCNDCKGCTLKDHPEMLGSMVEGCTPQ